MESEKLPSLHTFHLKAAADVSTWLYRVTHTDYESSALSSIGPGVITLPGASYHLDQAYPVSSLFPTKTAFPTPIRRPSTSSTTTTTSIPRCSVDPDPPSSFLSGSSSSSSSSSSSCGGPDLTDVWVDMNVLVDDQEERESIPIPRRTLSKVSSASTMGNSPETEYHFIQLSCSMPSTANLGTSPAPSSTPIPFRPTTGPMKPTPLHSSLPDANRASSMSSHPPCASTPIPPPVTSSSSFHPGTYTEYDVVPTSTSVASLRSMPSSPDRSRSPSERSSSRGSDMLDDSHVLVENVTGSHLDDGVFAMDPPPTPVSPGTLAGMAVTTFASRWQAYVYLTYRSGVPEVHSDTGWGCMHRTGQMLLAHAFARAMFGPVPVMHPGSFVRHTELYRRLLELFMDTPGAPFGLTALCAVARAKFRVRPGTWLSPGLVAWVLHHANAAYAGSPFVTFVSNTTVVHPGWFNVKEFKATVLFVSLRLGTRHVHETYARNLVDVFSWPQFLGIAGGKKNASLYFAGTWLPTAITATTSSSDIFRSTQFLYFDPHSPQKAVTSVSASVVPNPVFHTHQLRALPLKKVDPSMLLGFVFFTINDVFDFFARVQAWQQGALFYIMDQPPGVVDHGWMDSTE